MVVDLQNLFNNEGEEISIDFSMDLSGYDYNGAKPFTSPVRTVGKIKNTANVVELRAEVDFTVEFDCDRCADRSRKEFLVPIEHILVSELQDETNDDFLLVQNMELDLDDLVLTDVLLCMPTKLLCSDSCKGICAGCGKNLNREECACKRSADPRWDVLRDLLEEDD